MDRYKKSGTISLETMASFIDEIIPKEDKYMLPWYIQTIYQYVQQVKCPDEDRKESLVLCVMGRIANGCLLLNTAQHTAESFDNTLRRRSKELTEITERDRDPETQSARKTLLLYAICNSRAEVQKITQECKRNKPFHTHLLYVVDTIIGLHPKVGLAVSDNLITDTSVYYSPKVREYLAIHLNP